MSLTNEDVKRIADEVEVRLNDRRSIDEITHHLDHEFVRGLKNKDLKRREFWGRVQQQVVGWGAIVMFTAIVASLGKALISYVKDGNG